MKFILQLLFIIVIGFILELFLPWWSIAIAALLAGVLIATNVNFLAGFAGVALLWIIKALLTTVGSSSTLPEKVANIFPLHSTPLLFLVMALLGGLVGGFACVSGSLLKKALA